MKYYYGSDKILYIKLPTETEYLLAGCLTDNPMSEDSEFIPTSTRESQGWSTSKPIKQNYTLSFSGLQILTGADNGTPEMVSYDRLKKVKRLRGLIGWRLETIDKSLIDSGFAHIGTLSESSPVDGWLTYDCTLIGYGKPEDTISNGNGTPTGGGENPGGGSGGGGIPGGGGSNYNPNNRFRIIYMVDELDNVVSKIKTNYVNTFEIWSKNDNLFARFRDGDIPLPPEPRELDTVLYELYEGVGGEPFLELNMHFRGGASADYFNAGSGIVGEGANRAKEGIPVTVELSYDGGEINEGTGEIIPPWDAPVRVALTVTKNGVNFIDPIIVDYPVPPATGVLFGSSFVPEFGENWLIVAKVERI